MKIKFRNERKFIRRRIIAVVLLSLLLIVALNQAFSFVSAKTLQFVDTIQVSAIENVREKIDSGELSVKSYIINDGERLWDIAEDAIAEAGINVDTRNVVNVIKNINNAMGIDVNVLHEGQEIYIPVDLEEAL